jgi:hypothetical protein
MKTPLIVLSLWLISPVAFGQGLVFFVNSSTTLVSAGPVGQQAAIAGPVGSYFFGLLIASPGTTDPTRFTFTGGYATNLAIPGRLYGSIVSVPGWLPGSLMSYLVAGWSASLGHDWDQRWLSGSFVTSGEFGISSIATGIASAEGLPSLFSGATGIQSGWNLAPVGPIPEPTPFSMGGLGTALIMILRQTRTSNHRRTSR